MSILGNHVHVPKGCPKDIPNSLTRNQMFIDDVANP